MLRSSGYPNKAAKCVGMSSVEEAAMVWPPQTRNVAVELNTRSDAIGFHTKIEGLVHKFCSENFPTAGAKQVNRLQGGLSPGML